MTRPDVPRRLDANSADFEIAFASLLDSRRAAEDDAAATARAIVDDVRRRGDDALIDLAQRLDGVALAPEALRVSAEEIDAAVAQCPQEALTALNVAAERIAAYHRMQIPQDRSVTDDAGATVGWRWTPLDSVGIYVPGGTASYPSSVLMNAVPAVVAGVARVAMATPATGGHINPLVLAAAQRVGIGEVYRMGGAQAVAALAYGTGSVPAVDKIVGPGNAFVAAAKRLVFGQVGIDAIAGPSEILVVSDARSDPDWVAADLLSQAEHDPSSQCILITDDAGFADKVESAARRLLASLPRRDIAAASWRDFGAIIVVPDLGRAAPLIDRIAPEHLEIATDEPEALLRRVRHAGAIFLGRHTPEAMGDYIAGPNHVLPTSRTARYSSGLSVLDFMKRTTLLACSPKAIGEIGPHAVVLAQSEGLDAHARSIAARLKSDRK